jgi:hypothetical protein
MSRKTSASEIKIQTWQLKYKAGVPTIQPQYRTLCFLSTVPQSDHKCFLQNTYQFINCQSSQHSILYNLSYWQHHWINYKHKQTKPTKPYACTEVEIFYETLTLISNLFVCSFLAEWVNFNFLISMLFFLSFSYYMLKLTRKETKFCANNKYVVTLYGIKTIILNCLQYSWMTYLILLTLPLETVQNPLDILLYAVPDHDFQTQLKWLQGI